MSAPPSSSSCTARWRRSRVGWGLADLLDLVLDGQPADAAGLVDLIDDELGSVRAGHVADATEIEVGCVADPQWLVERAVTSRWRPRSRRRGRCIGRCRLGRCIGARGLVIVATRRGDEGQGRQRGHYWNSPHGLPLWMFDQTYMLRPCGYEELKPAQTVHAGDTLTGSRFMPAMKFERSRSIGPASRASDKTRQQLLEQDLQLHAGQLRAEAQVRAHPTEGHVVVGRAVDVEPVRLGELLARRSRPTRTR